MRCWNVLSCFSDGLLKLSGRDFSGFDGLLDLLSLHGRIVLRYHRPERSDWSMRSWVILGGFFKCLFKLFIGIIFIFCIVNELLQLSGGLLSVFDWIDCVHHLPWRIVLRDDWSFRCVGGVFGRKVLTSFVHGLFQLFTWIVFVCHWLNSLYGMPRRIILRINRSLGSVG